VGKDEEEKEEEDKEELSIDRALSAFRQVTLEFAMKDSRRCPSPGLCCLL
jgi:hypothetical protein